MSFDVMNPFIITCMYNVYDVYIYIYIYYIVLFFLLSN